MPLLNFGINVIRNQDTAVPCPYDESDVGKRHCRVLYIILATPELISYRPISNVGCCLVDRD